MDNRTIQKLSSSQNGYLSVRSLDIQEIQTGDLTDVTCNIRIQSGENDGTIGEFFWDTFLYDQRARHDRNWRSLFPLHRLGIEFSGRSGGSTEGVEDEPRVVGQQRDESLANCAGRSEDADLDGLCLVRCAVGGGGGHFRGGEVGGWLGHGRTSLNPRRSWI